MTDIVSVPSGNFTPGALAALSYPAGLINAAWNQANSKFSDFETKMSLVTNVGGTGWLDSAATPTISAGTATATTPTDPGVTIPTTLTAETVLALFDSEQTDQWNKLVDGIAAFRTTYFPDEATAFSAALTWLEGAVASTSGLPAAVAAQMLTDDKDRILAEVSRASDAVVSKFAAARFPLPPDAAAAAVLQLQQNGQSEIAASARKITIAGIEQIKFAISQLMGLRQTAMSAALEYARTMAGTAPATAQVVGAAYEAQSRLISAAAGYYNSRISAADLLTKNAQFNVSNALLAAEKNQAAQLTMLEDKLKAIMSELQALAQMATSLFNNLHASAGTSYGVNGT